MVLFAQRGIDTDNGGEFINEELDDTLDGSR